MGNALDLVIAMRKERQQRESADAEAIGNFGNNLLAGLIKGRELKLKEKGSAFDDLINAGKGIEAAKALNDPALAQRIRTAYGGNTNPSTFTQPATQASAPQTTSQSSTDPLQSTLAPTSLSNFIGETDAFGDPTERSKLAVKEAEANIAMNKEVDTAAAKDAEETGRSGPKAQSAVDTSFDAVMNFDNEQYEQYGIKPGDFLGLAAKLTPKQLNKFKAGAHAAGREASAIVGRQLVPQARGVNMVKVFEQSSAELGNSIEGNAENVAFTNGNIFANSIIDNITDIDVNTGQERPIQDLIIDPQTGVPLSQLPVKQRTASIIRLKNSFIRETEQLYLEKAFERNPNILKPESREKIIKSLPVFDSEEEGDSKVEAGKYYIVNGQLVRSSG